MARLHNHLIKVLMILSLGVLPAGFIECDLDDGELEVDIDGIRFYDHDWCDHGCVDVYYDEYYYDPWWDCCY